MASFYEKLSFVMGGDSNITPEFRQAFSDFNNFTTGASNVSMFGMNYSSPGGATVAAPASGSGQPRQVFDAQRTMFGLTRSTPRTDFSGQPASSITTGPAPQGGLYGPTVSFNQQGSAFGQVNPYAYAADRKTGASRLSADVIRAQFADYQSRFAPIEDFAVNALRPNGTMDGQFDVARSRQAVLDAGANLQGQQGRAMGRFGLQPTAPSIASSNEVTGGVVAGMNQARMADADRRLQMLGGGGGRVGG